MKDWIELLLIIIGLINAIIIPWAIWVTSSLYQLKSGLALNQQSDETRGRAIEELKTLIKDLTLEIHELTKTVGLLKK